MLLMLRDLLLEVVLLSSTVRTRRGILGFRGFRVYGLGVNRV